VDLQSPKLWLFLWNLDQSGLWEITRILQLAHRGTNSGTVSCYPRCLSQPMLTGVVYHHVQDLNDPTPECFAFITDDLVMVAFLGMTPFHASLNIYDLSLGAGNSAICTLLLPQVRYQSSMLNARINISGDQSSLWTPRPSLKVPFFTSHKNKVLGIRYLSYEASYPVSFVLFVPTSTILTHAHAIQTGESDCDTIPWDEWGVCGARFLHPRYSPSTTWVRCAYGKEFVLVDGYLRLYDFNPLSLKRALMSTEASDECTEILTSTDN